MPMRSLKRCARILLAYYDFEGRIESTEIVVPDTFRFTTTFSPANLSNWLLFPFIVYTLPPLTRAKSDPCLTHSRVHSAAVLPCIM
jgi:hypothetical protein